MTGPAIRGKQAAGDREDSSAGRELTDASDVQSLALILNGYSRAGFALEYTSMQASVSAGGRAAGRRLAQEGGSPPVLAFVLSRTCGVAESAGTRVETADEKTQLAA